MALGGKRPGAGRKPGVPNKVTTEREAQIASSGLTPLDFMLSVLRDETAAFESRFLAAEKAAPYCHAKLAAVTIGGDAGNPITITIAGQDAALL